MEDLPCVSRSWADRRRAAHGRRDAGPRTDRATRAARRRLVILYSSTSHCQRREAGSVACWRGRRVIEFGWRADSRRSRERSFAMTATNAPRVPTSPLDRISPGIKVAAQMSPEPSEQDLQLVRQMGVDHVVLWTDASKASAAYYASRRELFAAHGLTVYGFGNRDVHNQDAIVLGLANRDAKIEEYKRHLQALGAAGIPYTTYAHMPNGIWSTDPEETRGGALARAFDLEKASCGRWHDRTYCLPLTNGREYDEEEVWDNFAYFIRQAARVAEDEGVMIGIHPDDPPIPRLGGVPRIFSTFAGYQRALEIADSPNVGVCLCIGCWLEGGG